MATVTLKKPRRLNIGGIVFHKGIPTEVTAELAAQLEDDDRFVSGNGADAKAVRKKTPVRVKTVAEQIREAVGEIDKDDKAAFTDDGRPLASVLSKELGFKVTQLQVDKALNLKTKAKAPKEKASDPEAAKAPSNIKIVTKKTEPKTDGAKEETPKPAADGSAKDPSTEGAIA